MVQRVKLFSTRPDNFRVPHSGGETRTLAAMCGGMHGPSSPHTCTHTYMHTCISINSHSHSCTDITIPTCMHTNTYAHTHAHT